ncbi:hypothetical protein NHQ30_007585 [Ciborinia camelliae]|nr:hypothetical protein NHQ30_007585 [Ciborinia camelliae]
MATGFIHHIGTFLLFASAILLLITTISAPVINDIGILKVRLTNGTGGHHSVVSFGTFGYCVLDVDSNGNDYCTPKHIGYNPASIISRISSADTTTTTTTPFSHATEDTTKALTRVMILHPIACGIMFISFLLALGAGLIGSLLASLISFLAFITALVATACDFALFALVKHHVNQHHEVQQLLDAEGSASASAGAPHAFFSVGIWCVLAATIAGFGGTLIVFGTCLSRRIHERRERRTMGMGNGKGEKGYVGGVTPAKRHFWQRRERGRF